MRERAVEADKGSSSCVPHVQKMFMEEFEGWLSAVHGLGDAEAKVSIVLALPFYDCDYENHS